MLREESSLSPFPLPCGPPPALPPLPPEWKEAVYPQTGGKYYYNVETKESTWERPRSGKATQDDEDAAESEHSLAGIANGVPPSVEPSNPAPSLADADDDMEPNVGFEETDAEDSLPSPSTSDSAKTQQEIDNLSAKKSWWRPCFKPGGDIKAKQFKSTLPKSGISGDQTGIMELVKKAPIFELLEDVVLNAICDRLSLKQYLESSEVFRQNEPIEHMLFIMRGKLECWGEDGNISELREGDFCGEELLFLCIDKAGVTTSEKKHQGKHPLSSRTIECMTPVEAFSLDSEALKYITTQHKARFASPLVQRDIWYFSQYGWSLAATGKQKTWTSNGEKTGKARSTGAPAKLEVLARKEDYIKHDDKRDDKDSSRRNEPASEDALDNSSPLPDQVSNLQNVPTSEDTLDSPSPLGDADEVPKMDPRVKEDTSSLTLPLDRFWFGRRKVEGHGASKPWWGRFKSDGDQPGNKIQKWIDKRLNVGKKRHDILNPLSDVESIGEKDNTEEHGDDVHSPQAKAISEELSDTPMLTSPSLDENVLIKPNVGPEEQETLCSIAVPTASNSGKTEQENDSHGRKIQVNSGGHHKQKSSCWEIFKSDYDENSVSTLDLIKKVPIFKLLEPHILEAICEQLSWRRYTKRSEVVLKGESVTHMLFIVRGNLECLGEDGSTSKLKEGDFCGEELLSWFADRASASTLKKIDPDGRLPLSSRTIKCLTSVQAFSLDSPALENITTQFKFAFRSLSVQWEVRNSSPEWCSAAATRIQKAWKSGKGTAGAGQAHLNHETKCHDSCYEHLEQRDPTLDQGTERENSANGPQEAPSSAEPSEDENWREEREESIGDNGDDVPTPPRIPPEVLGHTGNSAPIKPPSEVLNDTANSAPPLVAEDERTKSNQEDTSNCRQDPPTSISGIEQEDGNHSAKNNWWRHFLAGNSGTKRPLPGKPEDPTLALEIIPRKFTYKQLKTATGGFSEKSKIGQGGFGSVYAGVLPSFGIRVAVKKMNYYSQNQSVTEFKAEVSIISRLRHRNLIQLLGWCDDAAKKKYLLVYELMPNGNLDEALFYRIGEKEPLSWSQRHNILTGTAAGLEYLHQGWNQQVIHRDIKCGNIILDENWNPKVGDFGLARLVEHGIAATTNVAGTIGYIAPEVIGEGKFTEKADVYGFGVVALEVACGRRVFSAHADKLGLIDFVWRGLNEGDLLSTVDQRLNDNYDEFWMEVVLQVGLLCTHPDPEARPSMRRVVQILAGDVPVPPIPVSKPTALYCSLPELSIMEMHIERLRAILDLELDLDPHRKYP